MTEHPPILSFAADPPAGAVAVDLDRAVAVDLDRLVSSRLLAQANSGAGKSTLLRALLEQTHGRVQHIVLDPEGEFGTLRERFDYLLAGQGADVPARPESAALLCRRVMELGVSLIADLYDLPLPDRRRFVRHFLEEMMSLPRGLWRPCLVVIDEAHTFCPEAGGAESADAVIALCTQGRKRGYSSILATQRLSKLHKDAAAELLNKLIGRTGLDVDLRRAADDLGFTKDQAAALKTLSPGQFYAYGPAISSEVALVQAPPVLTTLPAAGAVTAFAPPPASEAIAAIAAQMRDLPQEAEAEARDVETLRKRNAELERQIRDRTPAQAEPIVRTVEVEKRVEVPILTDGDRSRLGWMIDELEKRAESLTLTADELRGEAAAVRQALDRFSSLDMTIKAQEIDTPVPHTDVVDTSYRGSNDTKQAKSIITPPEVKGSIIRPQINRAQQTVLDVLATLAATGMPRPKRETVAVFAKVSPASGGYRNNLSTLRVAGLIEYPADGQLTLTDAGRQIAVSAPTPATLEDLHTAWKRHLSGPQGVLMDALVGAWPGALSREELAGIVGVSPTSGGYRNNLSTLSSMGLANYPDKGAVAATALLFPEGLG